MKKTSEYLLRFHGSGTGMTEKEMFPVLVRSFFPLMNYSVKILKKKKEP